MIRIQLPLFSLALLLSALGDATVQAQPSKKGSAVLPENLSYPNARRSEQVDDYHGTSIADPYRWLEETDSKETEAWVTAQNELTFDLLGKIPQRNDIESRLTKLWNYERFSLPVKRGDRFFFSRNDGLQNQSVLHVTDGLDGEPRVLLDPNALSEDGTVSLAGSRVSKDGKRLAYGLATAGSDWREWRVMDIDTGKTLDDLVRWIKFSNVAWVPDGSGFFYSRYDEPKEGEEFSGVNYFQKLYFHRIGNPQTADELIYERPDHKEWGFSGSVTEDGKYLVITVWRGTEQKNQVFYKALSEKNAVVVELIEGFDADYEFMGHVQGAFFFSTDRDAPNRRIVKAPLKRPVAFEEVVAEQEDVLDGAGLVGGRIVASYLHHAHTVVRIHDMDGGHLRDVELPAIGSAGGFGGRQDDPQTFYAFSNFTTPGVIYQYDVVTGQQSVFRQPQAGFDPDQFVTRQVFVDSKDGTKVPMFIVHRKGLKLDGNAPTILYGYGGFNISLEPSFSVANLVWLERGGTYALANLRGGGEYGRQWHEAGMMANKQNVFDDFIAAAEWLIESKHTQPSRLAIRGGSNGGLLVGAAMTQRPELFGAALPAVGVMDMLRFHRFTIGWAWVSEYGSSDEAEQFAWLLKYSPLHNLNPGVNYPPTLVTTGDHDDRVLPGHSFKFAATLQHCHRGDSPVLIRIETSAGHGAGTPTSKRIKAAADQLAFLDAVLR